MVSNPVIAAIVYWNTSYVDRATDHRKPSREELHDRAGLR